MQTGYNYIKGRYQLPNCGRFNRPDPMRDWDWENPASINLYQYVRNSPIEGWDPFGLDEFTDDPVVRAILTAMWELVGRGRKETERGAYFVGQGEKLDFQPFPHSARKAQEVVPNPPVDPENTKLAHTHPLKKNGQRGDPKPSRQDKENVSDVYLIDVYTISYKGIYKYTTKSGTEPTLEATSDIYNESDRELVSAVKDLIKADGALKRAQDEVSKAALDPSGKVSEQKMASLIEKLELALRKKERELAKFKMHAERVRRESKEKEEK